MECQTYYEECTKLSNPDRYKELLGVWRIKDFIGSERNKYVQVEKFAGGGLYHTTNSITTRAKT